MRKEFIDANSLLRDAFALAKAIYDSGYRPDVLLVVWRGGSPVGMAVHEYFAVKGWRPYHSVVKAESYGAIGRRTTPVIEPLDSVLPRIERNARVLVIDDVFETGSTMAAIGEQVRTRTSRIRIATLYVKQGKQLKERYPDFYLRLTARWIVFPHELVDLSRDELKEKDPYLWELMQA